jgi:peptidyl-prolyl cis-trans isomerase C
MRIPPARSGWRRRTTAVIVACLATTTCWAASLDDVVARRGGVELTIADIDAKIRSMPPELRSGYLTDPQRMAKVIDTLLITKQTAREAEKSGLGDLPQFKADLELARMELLSRYHSDAFESSLALPDFEMLAREKYLANPAAYIGSPRVDLRHVLIATDGRDEEAARNTAQQVYDRAKAGDDFLALIQEFSDESSKATRNGLIENADGNRLDPKFAEALGGLREVGDIIGPVRSRFGYHVVRLERYDRPQPVSFEQVAGKITAQLRQEYLADQRVRYLRSMGDQPVEFEEETLRQLPMRYIEAYGQPGPAAPQAQSAD